MPGRKAKTNRLLILLCIFLALVCGNIFTQSSALPSPILETTTPDMFVSDEDEEEETILEDEEDPDGSEPVTEKDPEEVVPIPEVSPTLPPIPPSIPSVETTSYEVSPEALLGTWISNENHWIFFVDGAAYKGWLTDTDGKCYYLNEDGIMQTGWLEYDGERYYLDLDGIMQTGDIWIDDTEYHFGADGILVTQ